MIESLLDDIGGQAEHTRVELVEALDADPSTSWDGALSCVRVRTYAFRMMIDGALSSAKGSAPARVPEPWHYRLHRRKNAR